MKIPLWIIRRYLKAHNQILENSLDQMPDGYGLTGNGCKTEPGPLPVVLNQLLIPGPYCLTFPRTSEPGVQRQPERQRRL